MRKTSLAAALLLLGVTGPPAPSPPLPVSGGLSPILEQAQQVQLTDIAAWKRFRFHRRIRREWLDDDGKVMDAQILEFRMSPASEGFDENLVRIDGRKPTPREVRHHRSEREFTRHYQAALAGEGQEGGYSMRLLLEMSSYHDAGLETVEGVPCRRFDFRPDPGRENPGMAGKFARAMAGSLWITAEGSHLLRARAKTVEPISIALSLAKVHGFRVALESESAGNGVWLPRSIEYETRARILVKQIHQRTLLTYSDFAAAGPPTALRDEDPDDASRRRDPEENFQKTPTE